MFKTVSGFLDYLLHNPFAKDDSIATNVAVVFVFTRRLIIMRKNPNELLNALALR